MIPWKYSPKRYYNFSKRTLKRGGKYFQLRWSFGRQQHTRPVFVLGAQRSGTNMLLEVLNASRHACVYNEDNRTAFDNLRLRPDTAVQTLIEKCCAPVVVFKPLCDSQHADRLLATFPEAKILWIYRCYQDSVNSSLRRHTGHVERARTVVLNENEKSNWYQERLDDTLISFARKHYREDIPRIEASAILWYLRTQFFYFQNLQNDPRVLLIQYEDLVTHPRENYQRIFDFVGCPFDERSCSIVRTTSIRKNEFGPISPALQEDCDALIDRLNREYERRLSGGE